MLDYDYTDDYLSQSSRGDLDLRTTPEAASSTTRELRDDVTYAEYSKVTTLHTRESRLLAWR